MNILMAPEVKLLKIEIKGKAVGFDIQDKESKVTCEGKLKARRSHVFTPRECKNRRDPKRDIFLLDKAVKLYLAAHTKPPTPEQPNGYLSKTITNEIRAGCANFCTFTQRPFTDHTISDLVTFKKNNPHDTTIENELRLLILGNSNMRTTSARSYASTLIGIFHKNFAPLQLSIHINGSGKAKRNIPEPTLRALFNELNAIEQDAILLMAYGAERRHAFQLLPLDKVRLIDETEYAILDIPRHLAKTGIEHPSIIPKSLAERLLQRAQENNYDTLFPNFIANWARISKFAKEKYHIKLTSHYFRTRYEIKAEKIPQNCMSPNHWMLLMGSRPSFGHMPWIYREDDDPLLIREYDNYLAPELALDSILTSKTDSQDNKITTLETTRSHKWNPEDLPNNPTEIIQLIQALSTKLTQLQENNFAKTNA